jgi:hypothetical protein
LWCSGEHGSQDPRPQLSPAGADQPHSPPFWPACGVLLPVFSSLELIYFNVNMNCFDQLSSSLMPFVHWHYQPLKGIWHEIFALRFFFMDQLPPGPWVSQWGHFEFWFEKSRQIFATSCLTPVSWLPLINFVPDFHRFHEKILRSIISCQTPFNPKLDICQLLLYIKLQSTKIRLLFILWNIYARRDTHKNEKCIDLPGFGEAAGEAADSVLLWTADHGCRTADPVLLAARSW